MVLTKNDVGDAITIISHLVGKESERVDAELIPYTVIHFYCFNISTFFSKFKADGLYNLMCFVAGKLTKTAVKDTVKADGQLTGPKPPPEDTYSGCLTRSNSSTCCRGVWLVDSFHGSDRT